MMRHRAPGQVPGGRGCIWDATCTSPPPRDRRWQRPSRRTPCGGSPQHSQQPCTHVPQRGHSTRGMEKPTVRLLSSPWECWPLAPPPPLSQVSCKGTDCLRHGRCCWDLWTGTRCSPGTGARRPGPSLGSTSAGFVTTRTSSGPEKPFQQTIDVLRPMQQHVSAGTSGTPVHRQPGDWPPAPAATRWALCLTSSKGRLLRKGTLSRAKPLQAGHHAWQAGSPQLPRRPHSGTAPSSAGTGPGQLSSTAAAPRGREGAASPEASPWPELQGC